MSWIRGQGPGREGCLSENKRMIMQLHVSAKRDLCTVCFGHMMRECVCVTPCDKPVSPRNDGEFPSFLPEKMAFLRSYGMWMKGGDIRVGSALICLIQRTLRALKWTSGHFMKIHVFLTYWLRTKLMWMLQIRYVCVVWKKCYCFGNCLFLRRKRVWTLWNNPTLGSFETSKFTSATKL